MAPTHTHTRASERQRCPCEQSENRLLCLLNGNSVPAAHSACRAATQDNVLAHPQQQQQRSLPSGDSAGSTLHADMHHDEGGAAAPPASVT